MSYRSNRSSGYHTTRVIQSPAASTGASTVTSPRGGETVDRNKLCPFLLRVFVKLNDHHSSGDFAVRGQEPKEDQLLIYTWLDATLGELTNLIQGSKKVTQMINKEVSLYSAPHSTIIAEFSISLIYPDRTGQQVLREIGSVERVVGGSGGVTASVNAVFPHHSTLSAESKTLQQIKLEIGDFLDVAIRIKSR